MTVAKVTLYREWPDGEKLQLQCEVHTSYPDALDQAKRTLLDGYAEALDLTVRSFTTDTDADDGE